MKVKAIIATILITAITFYLGFGYTNAYEPSNYYKVYLNDELLGTIQSKEELEKYIDVQGQYIKEKYNVTEVLAPEGLQIQKVLTYDKELTSVEEIYKEIQLKAPFTINAYEYNLKLDDQVTKIFVISKEIFDGSIEEVMKTFIGTAEYLAYKNDTQIEVITTGTYIKDVYVKEDITIKNIPISVDEKIYSTVEDLTKFFIYGEDKIQSTYIVKEGDTITSIAFSNKISEEEFLISNPKFTNKDNLVYSGQEVAIVQTNPQIKVVMSTYTAEDITNNYSVDERYDSERLKGDNEVIQTGENGLERVTQNVQTINGVITYVEPLTKVELKPAVNEIIVKGEKVIPNVGSLYSWLWPTNSGYKISSYYGYRVDPVYGGRELHTGLDITGLGYGSPVYATNNGTVIVAKYSSSYGNFIIVNHNNGYYSLYSHMQKFANGIDEGDTVSRGQIIGYVGSTGKSTGPHLHFEIQKNCVYCQVNPLSYLSNEG